jgi:membrane associated rhomboid family serine protease
LEESAAAESVAGRPPFDSTRGRSIRRIVRRAPRSRVLPAWLADWSVELPAPPAWLAGLPLVSVGIAAVWLLSLLAIELGFSGARREAEGRLLAAARFAIEHPEVEIDPRLLPVAHAVLPGFESNEMFAFLRAGRGTDRSSQQRFDGLARDAFAALDAHPYRVLGVVPARLDWHSAITHPWVHSGWAHGVATLLVFLVAAPALEALWGRAVFGAALALMALAGAVLHVALFPDSDRAYLGGSALAAGCLAALALRFQREPVELLGWLPPLAASPVAMPALGLVGVWVGYEASLYWAVPGTFPGLDSAVGWVAHAGGATAGGLVALAAQRLGWERERRPARPAARPRPAEAFSFQEVLRARRRGEHDRAFALLEAEVRRSARNRDAVTTWFQMCVERGEVQRAVPALSQLVREELRRGAEEIAVTQWLELISHEPRARLDPETLLRLAPAVQRQQGNEQALVALQHVLDAGKGLTPGLAARLAALAAELDVNVAATAARRALAGGGLDPAARAECEAIAARSPKEEDGVAPPVGKQPAPSVFYEESDRSAFGDVGEWSALDSFPDGALCEARPLRLAAQGVVVEADGRGEWPLSFDRVRAVAVAGVRGLTQRPVVLVDLLVDGGGTERPLSLVRLRSDRFDPRRLVPEATQPLAALLGFARRIAEGARAPLLPASEGSAATGGVAVFDGLDAYHEQVLRPAARSFG